MEDQTKKIDDSGIDMPADGVPQAAETAVMEPLAEAQEEQPETGEADESSAGSKKRRNVVIGVIAAAAVVAIGVGAFACSAQQQEQPAEEPQAAVEQEPEEEAAPDVATSLLYAAPGLDEGSTPVIVHVTGESAAGEEADFYHAFSAADVLAGAASLTLPAGDYLWEVLPSLNADGSLNAGSDGAVAPKAADDQDASDVVEVSGETTPAEDVTADQVSAVLDKVAEAASKGDSSLKGGEGEAVVDSYKQAAEANPNTSAEEVESKAEDIKQGTSGEAASAPGSGSSPQTSGGTSSGSGSASSGSSSSSDSSSGSGSSSQQTVTHTHNRVAQTEQRWVSNNVWVVDQAAYDEPQRKYVVECSTHRYTFSSQEEYEAHVDSLPHSEAIRDGSSIVSVVSGYIHHDEVGHYEDQGHYETVTTGYVCSVCGASL